MATVDEALALLAEALRAEVRAEVERQAGKPPRLLSVDEAAEALGVGRTAVYSEISAGRLRTIKVGRRRLVPSSSVDAFAAAGGPEQ
jgi:excisionase family DNA binding protein